MEKVIGRFNYKRRYSLPDDKLNKLNVAWDVQLYSSEGAWYHFYVPKFLEKDKEKLNKFLADCKYNASWIGDVVKCSYEFEPE